MNAREWLSTITDDQPGTVAAKAGIARRTLYHQMERGDFPVESIIKITSAYEVSPIEALIEVGKIDRAWANVPDIVAALRLASDDQLTDEILRRLKLGSDRFDDPLDELMARRSNSKTSPIRPVVDDGAPLRAADSSPDHPEEDIEFDD